MQDAEFVDYYEFLMVSPEADRAMIEWAVRLLVSRYGKKNGHFVDEARYNQVREAYRTLVDRDKREEYDRRRAARRAVPAVQNGAPQPPVHAPVVVPSAAAPIGAARRRDPNDIQVKLSATLEDVALEKRKRQALMSALYDILLRRPRNPELGRAEVARTVGVHGDELECAIWYMRDLGFLKTTNAGLYAITPKGVEWVEAGGVPHLATPAVQPAADEPSAPGEAPRPAAENAAGQVV